MPFIGNQLSTSFQNVETQTITGDGSTSYTLNNAVADGKDLLVYINNVKQEEGSGKSYTATGTTITFTEAVASTDSCYVVFIGQAIGTVTPKDGSIVSSMLADANLEMPNTLDLNGKELILDADADTSITADTDDQIDIKIAGSDNIRIKANEIENVSGDFTLDVAGDITLDANGQQIFFAKGGATFGQFGTESTPSNYTIESTVSDGDIIFKGNDGGLTVTALTLDMSDAGTAQFGHDIELVQSNFINFKHQAGGTIRATISADSSDNLTFGTGSSGTGRMTIDTDGKVLIGTTQQRGHMTLQIEGDGSASTAQGSIFLRRGLSTSSIGGNVGADLGLIQFGDNDGGIYAKIEAKSDASAANNDYPGRLQFFTTADGASSPTERMRINATGQVLIGTTSSLYSSTQKDGLQIEGAGGGPYVIVCKNVDTSGGANQILFLDGSGDTCGEIASNATNNTTSYGTSSDYRLKENITDVTNAISTLKKLKPKTYNFISDPDNISEDGFLAHELGAVVPNAVTGEKDAMTSDNEIKPQQVDYGRLTPLLTAALQEAVAKIETLEAKITALEAK